MGLGRRLQPNLFIHVGIYSFSHKVFIEYPLCYEDKMRNYPYSNKLQGLKYS